MCAAPADTAPEPPHAPWPAWTGPVAFLAAMCGAVVGGGLVAAAFAAGGSSLSNPPAGVNIIATVVQDLCLIGAAVIFARLGGRVTPKRFGLRPTRVGRALVLMAAGYVAFIVFTAIWLSALNIHQSEKILHDLGADRSNVAFAAVAVLVTVVAPIAEEFFFRGFFFTALRRPLGMWPAAVVTGLLFGAVHAFGSPAGYLVPLAFFGFVLCIIYARTGSLLPCMALHAINNAAALGSSKGWGWQIPLLMVGALLVIATIVGPIAARARDARLQPA